MADLSSQQADAPGMSQKERFFRYFQQEITALQEQMERLKDLAPTGGERSDAADHCLAGIARLSAEVHDASAYLPAYDQRTYSVAIKALQERLADTKASLAPRQRFTFKTSRKKASAMSLSDAAELAAERGEKPPGYRSTASSSNESSPFSASPSRSRTPTTNIDSITASPMYTDNNWATDDDEGFDVEYPLDPSRAVRRPTFSTVSSVSLSDESKVHIIVPTSASHATMPASITRIKASVVDIGAPTENGKPFASLTVKHIRKSLLVCGVVNGPAHITDVKDSVIVINCRQFRMHSCVDCVVYLACSSRPIIEDCQGIKFGDYPQTYITPLTPIPGPNLNTQIDDFNYIRPPHSSTTATTDNPHSPNWSLLPASDRVPEQVWRDVVPGGPAWGVREILKEVGVGVSGPQDR